MLARRCVWTGCGMPHRRRSFSHATASGTSCRTRSAPRLSSSCSPPRARRRCVLRARTRVVSWRVILRAVRHHRTGETTPCGFRDAGRPSTDHGAVSWLLACAELKRATDHLITPPRSSASSRGTLNRGATSEAQLIRRERVLMSSFLLLFPAGSSSLSSPHRRVVASSSDTLSDGPRLRGAAGRVPRQGLARQHELCHRRVRRRRAQGRRRRRRRVARGGPSWRGVERNRVEWNAMQCNGIECVMCDVYRCVPREEVEDGRGW